MRWSWKIATVAGIGIYLHATFLILLGFVGLSHVLEGEDLWRAAAGVGFMLALFACVVLHELGHALMAARFGVRTRDITLLPIGGVARLERIPENPWQELWIALAGPAVNVVIAAVLLVWLWASNAFIADTPLSLTTGPFLLRLMALNVFLVVFNMVPAFPMDGGRVLRALLAMKLPYARATQVAANIGQALALVFGFVGLFTNPFLLFIALFVWIGAAQEAGMASMRHALHDLPVRQAMLTDFRVLAPNDPLARAVDLILAGSQRDFPVAWDGHVVGVLLQEDLMGALAQRREDAPVGDVMRRNIEVVEAGSPLEEVFQRLNEENCHTVPVVERGRLVGLLTMENVGELLRIHAAVEHWHRSSHAVGAARPIRAM